MDPAPEAEAPSSAVDATKMPDGPPPAEEHDPAMPEGEAAPAVLHVATMGKNEREKVRRLVTPKSTTGNLAVPRDIYEMWETPQGKEKLLNMWCKSGGVARLIVLLLTLKYNG